MTYLIIIVVLLAIIAPILRILPSKDDKERMEKRRTAMASGVNVELVSITDPDLDPKKYRSSTGKPLPRNLSLVAYRMHRQRSNRQTQPGQTWQLVRYEAPGRLPLVTDWYWQDISTQLARSELFDFLEAEVPQLGDDVVQIEEKNQFISVYWKEAGDVTEVVDFLKRIVELRTS